MKDIAHLFSLLELTHAPVDLETSITERVRALERRQAKRRLALSSLGLAGSGVVTGMVGVYLYGVLLTTGFFYYVSLLVTTNAAVLAHWQAISLSIIASVPLVEAGIFLLGVTALLWASVSLLGAIRRLVTLTAKQPQLA